MPHDLPHDELTSLAQLGWAYLERGRLERAQKIFAGLSVLAPDMSYAWHALGMIAQKRGDDERAVGCLEHALRLDSQGVGIMLSLGEAHLRAGHLPQARAAFARVIGAQHASAPERARASALRARAQASSARAASAIASGVSPNSS